MGRNKIETYDEFVEKFKPKKTSDDCYTPPEVYELVKQWVNDHVMPLDGVEVVRPFWPGGDYQSVDYPENCIVVDNPPFSFLASIVDWYTARGIKFFLFAPHLTLFAYSGRPNITAIVVGATVTYENGALVNTSFITNAFPRETSVLVEGEFCRAIEDLEKKRLKATKKHLAKLDYPAEVITASILGKVAKRSIVWEVPRSESIHIKRLDCGKNLFGSGFLLSERLAAERLAAERLAAERLAAERLAAERLAAERLQLSPRERALVAEMRQ